MSMFQKNISICAVCPHIKGRGGSKLTCEINEKSITDNAITDNCPKDFFKNVITKYTDISTVKAKILDADKFQRPANWSTLPNVQAAYRELIQEYIPTIPEYDGHGIGRGIVIAGGGSYFCSAFTVIKLIRHLDWDWPIELWGLPYELPEWQQNLVRPYDVECRIWDTKLDPPGKLHGWELKTVAAKRTKFEEFIFLDADAIPQINLEYLFDEQWYKDSGAIFWPDLENDPSKYGDNIKRPVAVAMGMPKWENAVSFETGQFIINKKKWWKGLCLSHWLCTKGWEYFFKLHIWYGDKQCPFWAAKLLNLDYAITQYRPKTASAPLLLQRDFQDRPIIAHGTQRKLWNLESNIKAYPEIKQDTLTMALFAEANTEYRAARPPTVVVGITVAVDYVDRLEKTLANKKNLKEWVIVTVEGDPVIDFCAKNGLYCVISENLHLNKSLFNLGALRNEGMDFAIERWGPEIWLLFVDGDCKLPTVDFTKFDLSIEKIYGAHRYGDGSEKLDEGITGFFQLFHASEVLKGKRYQEDWPDAGGTDLFFRDLWGDAHKKMLDIHLHHLGTSGIDWKGRVRDGIVGLTKAALGIDKSDQSEQRLAICNECPKAVKIIGNTKQCAVCKCFLKSKVKIASEKCPLGKW